MKKLEDMTIKEIGKFFELFIYEPITSDELKEILDKCIKYNLRSFICPPDYVAEAKEYVKGKDLLIASGGSFPFGLESPTVKAQIARECKELGADVIEIPLNLIPLKNGNYEAVEREMRAVREAATDLEYKVLVECCKLTDDEIRKACEIAIKCNVDVFKTGSGANGGPNMEQVCVALDALKGTNCRVKVSGIKFPPSQNAYMFIKAGASMIGKGKDIFRTIDGIQFLKDRGIV